MLPEVLELVADAELGQVSIYMSETFSSSLQQENENI